MSERQPVQILLIEDNPADARITAEAAKEAGIVDEILTLQESEEIDEFLHLRGRFAEAASPDLILLDLNLPGKGGMEILADLKSHPTLRRVPVVVLTTSRAEQDILEAYRLHANCYLIKPINYEGMLRLLRQIEEFWLKAVRLPPKI